MAECAGAWMDRSIDVVARAVGCSEEVMACLEDAGSMQECRRAAAIKGAPAPLDRGKAHHLPNSLAV